MSDKAVPFFNPSDPGLGGDWIVQSNGIKDASQRAQGLKANGDEAAHKLFDGKAAGPVVFECHVETGNLTIPNVGSVIGGYVVERCTLRYNATGWPQLTLDVHQHDDNPHADGELNEFAATPTFPAQFGIPRSLTIGATSFALTDTDAGMNSLEYSLGAVHVDESENGLHLAGDNRDGIETLNVGFTKDPATVTAPTGWDLLSDGPDTSNTAAERGTMAWEHHIARET